VECEEDLAVGTRVHVVSRDSIVLQVKRVEN